MNIQQARTLVTDTFPQPFDKARFRRFAINLLHHIDETKARVWNTTYIKDAFKGHVKSFERLGTYTSPEKEKLDILIVYLTAESKLERARTAIRNFVADHLKTRDNKDAALVAFVSPTEKQWRFSYVKMEYAAVENEDGKVAVKTKLTPARRSSYIVGEGESCHTAQGRFLDLLRDTENRPTLAKIEEAFSVEAVTKEFFEQYKALYLDLKDALDALAAKDKTVGKEFAARHVGTADFAKKLMGQIVFLYFLQKKGWLGVPKGGDWGDGPHNFLRQLFDGKFGPHNNFFNDILEPLFYDTLATDRGHAAWCKRFHCRIPFLNGGLFEPLGNYDWEKTDIVIPDALFSNAQTTKAGDTGTGILDIFDRYNFTVNEAEPLEKEVAIDPEMLGKVFENLLGVEERKSKGSFYTPREIVHYMCQESLINYLDTAINTTEESVAPEKPAQTKLFGEPEPEQTSLKTPVRRDIVPRGDIETFVHLGDQISHYEAVDTRYAVKMPKSIQQNARRIDEKLADIAVCDPAIGSGAFPVGMMHEIVRARCALTPYFKSEKSDTDIPVCDKGSVNTPVCAQGDTDIPVCDKGSVDIPVCAQGDTDIPVCDKDSVDTPVCAQGDTDIPVCDKGSVDTPVCARKDTGRNACATHVDKIHQTRRNLPHWTKDGSIYWITFRLADALPREKLDSWKHERDIWLARHPKPWSDADWKEYDKRFGERLQTWLDAGYGSCSLARPEVRRIVQDCLLRFDGEKLLLHAGVIMPNHVHLLLEPLTDNHLSTLLKGIKGASSHKVKQLFSSASNAEQGQTGMSAATPWTYWMDESYDHIVRSQAEYQHLLRYIADNPVKANLRSGRFWLYEREKSDTDIPVCEKSDTVIPVCETQPQTFLSVPRTPYHFKRHAIQNCLYGVDIDPGAVEIAKLRLWLSLVVDEDDVKQIKPLPNLDYKIVVGNSLLGVERDVLNANLFEQLEELKPRYFNATERRQKERLKREIDELIHELTNGNEVFDFEIYFSEVFHQNGGFDVVIGNPPYLRVQGLQKTQPGLVPIYKHKFKAASGSFDLYGLFIEQGFGLLRQDGHFAYIVPHKFFQATFGKGLRALLSGSRALKQIVRFGAEQVFDEPSTYTCLLFLSKQPRESFHLFEVSDLSLIERILSCIQHRQEHDAYTWAELPVPTSDDWDFHTDGGNDLLDKLQQNAVTLGDVTRKIFVGLQTSADKIYVLAVREERRDTTLCFSKHLKEEVEIERGLLKPFLMGKDVHRYAPVVAKNVVIFPYIIENGKASLMSQEHIKREFPLGWKYLKRNQADLANREHGKMHGERFYAYIYPKNLTEFEAIKIMTPEIALGCQMSLDSEGRFYHTTKVYSFIFRNPRANRKYFLGLLNSKVLWYFLSMTGYVLRGGYYTFKTDYLKPFPIPESTSRQEQDIVRLVDLVIATKQRDAQADTSALEREIDELVYGLYGLTPKEIEIVEGTVR